MLTTLGLCPQGALVSVNGSFTGSVATISSFSGHIISTVFLCGQLPKHLVALTFLSRKPLKCVSVFLG